MKKWSWDRWDIEIFVWGIVLVSLVALGFVIAGCSQGTIISNSINVLQGKTNGIATPAAGKWDNYALGATTAYSGNQIPIGSDPVGYIYTQPPATFKQGATVTLSYTIIGSPNYSIYDNSPPGKDPPPASLTLFAWERGDDMNCDQQTGPGIGGFADYRMWNPLRGSMTPGSHTLTAVIDGATWTGCYGKSDPAGFSKLLGNLMGTGFTAGGASFYGHGVTSNPGVTLRIDGYQVR